MAHNEEKILGYLDGTLGEADREALLAEIAAKDGEARALFDAHIKLEELYTLVQKPVSAPLSVQRELASKLPFLAVKLPYLAPVDRRDRTAAGWFSTHSSFVNVFLIAIALMLSGGLWYGLNHHNPEVSSLEGGNYSSNSSSMHPNSKDNSSMNNSAVNNSSRSGGNNVASASMGSIPGATGANDIPANSRSGSAGSRHGNLVPTVSHSPMEGTHFAHNGNRSNSISSRMNLSHLENRGNLLSKENKIPTQPAISKNHASNSASAHEIPTTPKAAAPELPQPSALQTQQELPPLAISIVAVPDHTLNYTVGGNILKPYPEDENSSHFTPLHFAALAGPRIINYFRDEKSGYSNSIASNLEIAAEYELSPWIAVGLHGGYSSFAQMATIPSIVTSQYGYSHIILSNMGQLNSAFWFGPSITGTLNPQDPLRYSLLLSGGPALTKPMGWIGIVSGDMAYDLSNALVLHIDPSFDLSRINPATLPAASNQTEGYVATSSPTALVSRAFGISLGISFHP